MIRSFDEELYDRQSAETRNCDHMSRYYAWLKTPNPQAWGHGETFAGGYPAATPENGEEK